MRTTFDDVNFCCEVFRRKNGMCKAQVSESRAHSSIYVTKRAKPATQHRVIFSKKNRSSEQEHRADALALGADEGRDKLRKASVRSTYPTNRRYPNGETRQSEGLSPLCE